MFTSLDMSGRVAVIVGAAQGIGFSTARVMGEMGASLVLMDRNGEVLVKAANELSDRGIASEQRVLDVVDSKDVRRAMEEVATIHGRLDSLVNCAGVASHGPSLDVEGDEWRRVIGVNLDGAFWCAREAARQMISFGEGGSIVTIGSISGEVANVPQNQTAYNSSKAGVHNMTRCLAVEWASHGIRVNAVAPGYVETELTRGGLENPLWANRWSDLTPMGRVAQPDEIARVAAFLSSRAASYMTGSIVTVDGGYLSM
ncbi:MAG: SDR family oxidoreductase [Acidimicrobiaceae bacterium]